MALSLPGERSVAAAARANPFTVFVRWLARAQAARARRTALASLLELDDARLVDLGIARHDIVQALRNKGRGAGLTLSAARTRNARL